MALDVFSRSGSEFGGAIAADAARVVFSAAEFDGGIGMMVQSLNISYMQQVSRLFEIGSDRTYLIIGRTQGQAGMGRIVGPRPIQLAFYQRFGDACRAAENNLDVSIAAGCGSQNGVRTSSSQAYTVKTIVLTSIGLTVNAADMLINEQVGMMFNALQFANFA